jgi:O-antigen/teichoic acid export membrane protein
VLATDVAGTSALGTYLRVRACTAGLALLALLGVAAATGGARGAVIALVGVAKAIEALGDLCYGACQRAERLELTGVSLALRGLVGAGCFAFALRATGSTPAGQLALVAVWAAVLLAWDLPNALRAPAPEGPATRGALALVRAALPLGLATMAGALVASAAPVALERWRGPAAVAVYGAAAALAVLLDRVASPLLEALTPRLARLFREERPAFVRLVRRLALGALGVGATVVAVGATAGGPLLALVYGEPFRPHGPLLAWVLLYGAANLLLWVLVTALNAAQAFRPQLALRLVGLVAAATGCALLVPERGELGAAWAVAAAGWTQVALAAGLLAHVARRPRAD